MRGHCQCYFLAQLAPAVYALRAYRSFTGRLLARALIEAETSLTDVEQVRVRQRGRADVAALRNGSQVPHSGLSAPAISKPAERAAAGYDRKPDFAVA
jgi:hypothetical protein